jgi:hypothetical protein
VLCRGWKLKFARERKLAKPNRGARVSDRKLRVFHFIFSILHDVSIQKCGRHCKVSTRLLYYLTFEMIIHTKQSVNPLKPRAIDEEICYALNDPSSSDDAFE